MAEEERPSRIRVYFGLWGEFDPEEVTATLGVVPTATWRRGDRCSFSTTMAQKTNHWAFGTAEKEGFDLPSHVEFVLQRLELVSTELNEVRERLGLTANLNCVVWVGRPTPILSFPRETLQRISALGAGFDIDTYLA